jgi:hypothetical protein
MLGQVFANIGKVRLRSYLLEAHLATSGALLLSRWAEYLVRMCVLRWDLAFSLSAVNNLGRLFIFHKFFHESKLALDSHRFRSRREADMAHLTHGILSLVLSSIYLLLVCRWSKEVLVTCIFGFWVFTLFMRVSGNYNSGGALFLLSGAIFDPFWLVLSWQILLLERILIQREPIVYALRSTVFFKRRLVLALFDPVVDTYGLTSTAY